MGKTHLINSAANKERIRLSTAFPPNFLFWTSISECLLKDLPGSSCTRRAKGLPGRCVLTAAGLAGLAWCGEASQETFALPDTKEWRTICRHNQTPLHTLCPSHLHGARRNLLLTETDKKCSLGQSPYYKCSQHRKWLPKLSPSGSKFHPTSTREMTFRIILISRQSKV